MSASPSERRLRCVRCGYCETEDLTQPLRVVRESATRVFRRCGACCEQTAHRVEEVASVAQPDNRAKVEPLWSVKHRVNIGQSGPVADSEAASAAAMRLSTVDGSIYRAFDGLNCGVGHEAAVEYLAAVLPDAKAIGAALAFAMVAVESDRGRR